MNVFSFKNIKGNLAFLKGFWVIFGFALVLRLVGINDPLSSDELVSVSIWGQMPLDQIPKNYQLPNNHIFHTFLVGLLLKFFGIKEFALRMPALAGGLISVILVFVCAQRITNNYLVALGSAFMLAINIEHIYYSTNARGYILTQAFALAVFILILPFISKSENGEIEKNYDSFWLNYFLIFVFCGLGSWTIPTFGLYEGSLILAIVFSLLFYRNYIANRIRFFTQLLIILVFALGILYIQYFIVIPRNMLDYSFAIGARVELIQFFEGFLKIFLGSQIYIDYGMLFFAIIGFVGFFKKQRIFAVWLGFLFIAPLVIVFLPYFIGISQKVSVPRILFYLQPFFLICVCYGVLIFTHQLNPFFINNKYKKISIACIFGTLFITIFWFAVKDFRVRQIIARNQRAPYNDALKFFKQLGSNDLIITSRKTHVWFYLYGAKEMRKRVLRIMEAGKLGNVYFIEDFQFGSDQSDLKVKTLKKYIL